MASKVLKAAELAKVAAGKAAAEAEASEEIKAGAKMTTAEKAAAAVEAEVAAAGAREAAAAAILEAAALEVKIEPPAPFDHRYAIFWQAKWIPLFLSLTPYAPDHAMCCF